MMEIITEGEAGAFARRIRSAWQTSIEAIFETGRLIAEAKDALPHGAFTKMIEADLPFGARTARKLMAIAADQRLAERTHESVLPPHWGTLYELTRLDDEAFDRSMAEGVIRPEMERREIATIVKKERRQQREADLAARQSALPQKRYGVICADPEWRFEAWSIETGMDRAADNHYPTSSIEEIRARPVAEIAADDAVLFLWVPRNRVPDGLGVMSAWGFAYVTCYGWDKEIAGNGYWNLDDLELLLVGKRGDIPCPAPGTQWRALIHERKTDHSTKPEQVALMIEAHYPNLPKIELNARRARPGWDVWGLEAPESGHAAAPAEAGNRDSFEAPKVDTTFGSSRKEENYEQALGAIVLDRGKLTQAKAEPVLRAGRGAGRTPKQLAEDLGHPVGTIKTWLNRLGLTDIAHMNALNAGRRAEAVARREGGLS